MKPLEEISLFWHARCKEINNCHECPRKFHCSWATGVIRKNGCHRKNI